MDYFEKMKQYEDAVNKLNSIIFHKNNAKYILNRLHQSFDALSNKYYLYQIEIKDVNYNVLYKLEFNKETNNIITKLIFRSDLENKSNIEEPADNIFEFDLEKEIENTDKLIQDIALFIYDISKSMNKQSNIVNKTI